MFTDNFLTLSVFAQQVIGHEVQVTPVTVIKKMS